MADKVEQEAFEFDSARFQRVLMKLPEPAPKPVAPTLRAVEEVDNRSSVLQFGPRAASTWTEVDSVNMPGVYKAPVNPGGATSQEELARQQWMANMIRKPSADPNWIPPEWLANGFTSVSLQKIARSAPLCSAIGYPPIDSGLYGASNAMGVVSTGASALSAALGGVGGLLGGGGTE